MSTTAPYGTANSDGISSRDRTVAGPTPDDGGGGGGGPVSWGSITDTPTTLAGYGITDAASDAELTAFGESLHAVAFTGDYDDLENLPSLADVATSGLASDVAFASGVGLTATDVAAALDELYGLIGGGGASPLTTKGDLWGFSTVDARLPVGTNGYMLYADSTQPLGMKWDAPPSGGGGGGGSFQGAVADHTALLAEGASVGDMYTVDDQPAKLYMAFDTPTSDLLSWYRWDISNVGLGQFRFIRLYITGAPGGYIELIKVAFLSGGGTIEKPTVPMTSANTPSPLVASHGSSLGGGWEAWRAFDNNAGTRWHSNNSNPDWIKLDNGIDQGFVPDGIKITCYLGSGSRYPSAFEVQTSPTGLFAGEETVHFSTSGETAWSDGVERTFTW